MSDGGDEALWWIKYGTGEVEWIARFDSDREGGARVRRKF